MARDKSKTGRSEAGSKPDKSAIYSISRMDRASRAVENARVANKSWAERRNELGKAIRNKSAERQSAVPSNRGKPSIWTRETYRLPRDEARERARLFFQKYPKAAYWSEVESWRVLENDIIEFTLRRLPSAD